MSKKHFIELADKIRWANLHKGHEVFSQEAIEYLASFCASQNPMFNKSRWLAYIAGECGPNGGAVKKELATA